MLLTVGELNAFFLKSVLLILDSNLNMVRLAVMALQTYTAVHDFHIFAVDKTNRLGANAWLTSAIVSLEFILVVKHIHERGMFESYLPAPYIVNCWMAFFAILLLLMLFKCLRMVYLWAWSSSEVGGEKITSSRTATVGRKMFTEDRKRAFFAGYAILNRGTQILTIVLPMPLIAMLLMDCWRTFAYHPPPLPGVDEGW